MTLSESKQAVNTVIRKATGGVYPWKRFTNATHQSRPKLSQKNAVVKINDSFPEVLNYWPNLKEWVFVHNNDKGITTKVSDCLEKLREDYPNIKILTASRRFLKDELHDKLKKKCVTLIT